MDNGTFYFIKNNYFTEHDSNNQMMHDKGSQNQRPCFFAFPDTKYPDILWCIPISSQVAKFEAIVNHKKAKMQQQGIDNPDCSTIRFGKVMGARKAFLIQNMFPVTRQYISHQYIDPNSHKPVSVSPAVEKDVRRNARTILKLVERGHTHFVFSNILETKQKLITQENLQKKPDITHNQNTGKQSIKDRLAQAQNQAVSPENTGSLTPKKHTHNRT